MKIGGIQRPSARRGMNEGILARKIEKKNCKRIIHMSDFLKRFRSWLHRQFNFRTPAVTCARPRPQVTGNSSQNITKTLPPVKCGRFQRKFQSRPYRMKRATILYPTNGYWVERDKRNYLVFSPALTTIIKHITVILLNNRQKYNQINRELATRKCSRERIGKAGTIDFWETIYSSPLNRLCHLMPPNKYQGICIFQNSNYDCSLINY